MATIISRASLNVFKSLDFPACPFSNQELRTVNQELLAVPSHLPLAFPRLIGKRCRLKSRVMVAQAWLLTGGEAVRNGGTGVPACGCWQEATSRGMVAQALVASGAAKGG
jgi:hypothetical protein